MITRDSSLAFFINQLDNFDTALHEPLTSVTWSRDIKLRPGVSLANQSTTFTRGAFARAGTIGATGKSWVGSGKRGAIPSIQVDGTPVTSPINVWAMEIAYTSVELERSQLIGQNLDNMQTYALIESYNMDVDGMVYTGDSTLGITGLVNSAEVNASLVVAGASTLTAWASKTADEILFDVNDAIKAAWARSAYAVCPNVLGLPPTEYALIVGKKAGTDGAGGSILKYLEDNSMALQVNGKALSIRPMKYLDAAGVDGKQRMIAYSDSERHVRYNLAPVRRETPYYQGITFAAPYVAGLGCVEYIYPETAIYRDGI